MKNNASPIKSSQSRTSDEKSRKRLALLVHAFLEIEIKREDLISDPKKIDQYQALLGATLWQRRIDPHDPDWVFHCDLSDIALDNPTLYPSEQVSRANLDQGVNTLLHFHGLLKSFWDDFKKHLEAFQGVLREREAIQTLADADKALKGLNAHGLGLEGLGQQLLDAIYREREYSQEIESSIDVRIKYTFETGRVHFFYSGIDAVRALMDLLKDVPIGDFKKCKAKACGKWFVMTSKRRRDFCSHPCAARQIEKDKRDADPNGFNKYHKDYYHARKKKTGES